MAAPWYGAEARCTSLAKRDGDDKVSTAEVLISGVRALALIVCNRPTCVGAEVVVAR